MSQPLDPTLLRKLSQTVGTPFWLYDAARMRKQIQSVKSIAPGGNIQARFAMKACPATRVLREMQQQGIWIDAVSGNEVLRALNAGHAAGSNPPHILFTADVFRDNALEAISTNGILPNIGSPGMIDDLVRSGYRGPISMRVNPGFGHGHVNACDTGGPSSKHGIWFTDAVAVAAHAKASGLELVMLHAHIGSGPRMEELLENLQRLAGEMLTLIPHFPALTAISLGGGLPHNYREPSEAPLPAALGALLRDAQQKFSSAAGRDIRVEIEPGRYFVAATCTLVARVAEVKKTRTNDKGDGATFVMVDAGFGDLIRPAMYGSYHRISIIPQGSAGAVEPLVVAGPMCESGDIFTRDEAEILVPRELPLPVPGDLLVIHDAGAYGYAMSSNYNSFGRAPQVWLEEDGSAELISRRETWQDLLKAETSERVL